MTWWAWLLLAAAGAIGYAWGTWRVTSKLLDSILREDGERARADKLEAELQHIKEETQ